MSCKKTRDQLMSSTAGDRAQDHLRSCPACREFAGRLELTRQTLEEHHGNHQPDPLFAQRVTAALPDAPDMLGWAAMRLLPATLAAALVLSAWCWIATPGPGSLVDSLAESVVEEAPSDDLLAWVLEEDGS